MPPKYARGAAGRNTNQVSNAKDGARRPSTESSENAFEAQDATGRQSTGSSDPASEELESGQESGAPEDYSTSSSSVTPELHVSHASMITCRSQPWYVTRPNPWAAYSKNMDFDLLDNLPPVLPPREAHEQAEGYHARMRDLLRRARLQSLRDRKNPPDLAMTYIAQPGIPETNLDALRDQVNRKKYGTWVLYVPLPEEVTVVNGYKMYHPPVQVLRKTLGKARISGRAPGQGVAHYNLPDMASAPRSKRDTPMNSISRRIEAREAAINYTMAAQDLLLTKCVYCEDASRPCSGGVPCVQCAIRGNERTCSRRPFRFGKVNDSGLKKLHGICTFCYGNRLSCKLQDSEGNHSTTCQYCRIFGLSCETMVDEYGQVKEACAPIEFTHLGNGLRGVSGEAVFDIATQGLGTDDEDVGGTMLPNTVVTPIDPLSVNYTASLSGTDVRDQTVVEINLLRYRTTTHPAYLSPQQLAAQADYVNQILTQTERIFQFAGIQPWAPSSPVTSPPSALPDLPYISPLTSHQPYPGIPGLTKLDAREGLAALESFISNTSGETVMEDVDGSQYRPGWFPGWQKPNSQIMRKKQRSEPLPGANQPYVAPDNEIQCSRCEVWPRRICDTMTPCWECRRRGIEDPEHCRTHEPCEPCQLENISNCNNDLPCSRCRMHNYPIARCRPDQSVRYDSKFYIGPERVKVMRKLPPHVDVHQQEEQPQEPDDRCARCIHLRMDRASCDLKRSPFKICYNCLSQGLQPFQCSTGQKCVRCAHDELPCDGERPCFNCKRAGGVFPEQCYMGPVPIEAPLPHIDPKDLPEPNTRNPGRTELEPMIRPVGAHLNNVQPGQLRRTAGQAALECTWDKVCKRRPTWACQSIDHAPPVMICARHRQEILNESQNQRGELAKRRKLYLCKKCAEWKKAAIMSHPSDHEAATDHCQCTLKMSNQAVACDGCLKKVAEDVQHNLEKMLPFYSSNNDGQELLCPNCERPGDPSTGIYGCASCKACLLDRWACMEMLRSTT